MISLYTPKECAKIARKASLRHVNDSLPGISRKRCGKGFAYYFPNGRLVKDIKILKRIKSLGIPPAYQKVWICPFYNGHIQATGRDEKNRKQYVYHPQWTKVRTQQKFELMIQFGSLLPLIRSHVTQELEKPLNMTKSQVISGIIFLLDNTSIRIGTPIYAVQHQSYGLTTLRKKHLLIKKNKAFLNFTGKSAQLWSVMLQDKKMIKLLKKCEEIPGYELFKYIDDRQHLNLITSQEVNAYLKSLTQHPFTAKDFRTWTACRETFYRLLFLNSSDVSLRITLNKVVKEVAQLLGHTPTVCQKNYIQPEIIECWKKKVLEQWKNKYKQKISKLNKDELLLFWLENKEC